MKSSALHRHRVPLSGDDGVSAVGAAPPRSEQLGLAMQKQAQDEWCWAAVSASVAAFYVKASTWTQCRIVNDILGRKSCCEDGGSSDCNQPSQLEKALALVRHLAEDDGQRPPLDAIAREIDAGRPVALCIDWTGGGGHFVAVDGYDLAAGTIDVKDSLFGPSHVPYASFPEHYQGGGTWSWTYRTRPEK